LLSTQGGLRELSRFETRRLWDLAQGHTFLALVKMSRTRDAPTPTNISTNSDPDAEMNGTPASPA
jgi:hypothetical protein